MFNQKKTENDSGRSRRSEYFKIEFSIRTVSYKLLKIETKQLKIVTF